MAIAPLNEIPDDEYPATLDDVIWIAPEYIKVSIRFVRDVDSQKREYSLDELDAICADDAITNEKPHGRS